MPLVAIWRAIWSSCSRAGTWAENAAGVASTRSVVVISPVDLPAACATSSTVLRGCKSGPRPTAPKNVRTPVAKAVPDSALSPITRLAEEVSIRPTTGKRRAARESFVSDGNQRRTNRHEHRQSTPHVPSRQRLSWAGGKFGNAVARHKRHPVRARQRVPRRAARTGGNAPSRGRPGAVRRGGQSFSEGKPSCFRGKNPYFGHM